MIVVKFCSGIGNQLYQYAIYLILKKYYPDVAVKADISVFEDYLILNKGNGFTYGFAVADFFNVNIDIASINETKAVNWEVYFGKTFRYLFPKIAKKYCGSSYLASLRGKVSRKYSKLRQNYISNAPFNSFNGNIFYLNPDENYYVSGLWQNYKYLELIENELREALCFSNKLSDEANRLVSMISSTNSVCLHVRRGDFTISKHKYSHDICGNKYYAEAIRIIEEKFKLQKNEKHEKLIYYIFSDDIEFCKKQFAGVGNIVYVSARSCLSTQEEMYLMGLCKAAIISNSTFAFWSVWLTDDEKKTVVYPMYCVRSGMCWNSFSVPNHWIGIDNLSLMLQNKSSESLDNAQKWGGVFVIILTTSQVERHKLKDLLTIPNRGIYSVLGVMFLYPQCY